MKKRGVLPMESYQLVQYAVQVPCYLCDGGNTFDAEFCRHCRAPMSLAQQAAAQKVSPRLLAAVGPAGVGKTVYLGMLTDMLSRQSDQLQLLARGAFSISLQQSAMASLARCELPQATPEDPAGWNWMYCQLLTPRRHASELILPDMSGPAIFGEIEHSGTFPIVRGFLSRCSGILLLVDAAQLDSGDQDPDFAGMKVISYLCELCDDKRKGWPRRPVAIVFTKADRCEECFDDPAAYARKAVPGLWQLCQQRLARFRFFATSVIGSTATLTASDGYQQEVPLRIEPRGVVEPFTWLVEQAK